MIANFIFVCVIAASCVHVAYMFTAFAGVKTMPRTSIAALRMGGGRSKEEVGLSKRQMFQKLKTTLNTEAKAAGFFDVGDKIDIELYCKANKDGTQVGDCPFAQFVQLVLLKKGLNYAVKPTMPSNKPAWITESHGGKLPLLVHKDTVITESLKIAEHIEKAYPYSSLTRQGAYSYQEVLEKTNNLFPALKALILNKDAAKDADLLAALNAELDIIDGIVRSTPGQYIAGIELTLADLYLLPLLFHAFVAVDHFKGIEIYHIDGEPVRPAFENYFGRLLDLEEFNNKKAYVNADSIINGWKIARGDI